MATKLRPPVNFNLKTLQGLASTINADGTITVSDAQQILMLQSLGFEVQVMKGRTLMSGPQGLLPSATLNVNGAPGVMSPGTGYTGFVLNGLLVAYLSVGSETVTVTATPTYTDGTTGSAQTYTATTTSVTTLTETQLQALQANGKDIASIQFLVKSSINSSTASVNINPRGYNAD